MKKKKILYLSDFSKSITGFGRNAKAVLLYLYKTGKYEIVEYATAPFSFKDKRLESVPWKAYGALPENEFTKSEIKLNPQLEHAVKYGSFYIDKIIDLEKPDIFIGCQDFWAFEGFYDKPWWNKIHCALWITLDSLPIYKDAIDNADKIKNFWVWSKFAENEFKRLGYNHIKTLPGAFDTSDFRPLENKQKLRKSKGISGDEPIFGFVFRNQTRKLVGSLIEGFSIFKKKNIASKAKLLLHTDWSEGWNIQLFMEEFGVEKSDVLTTFVCSTCKNYELKPFVSENCSCSICKNEKSQITVKTYFGVSEAAMNEIYNVMDFYIHPVNSGGLEMPLVESLLAGTPIATVNYSCGEEFCEQDFVETIQSTPYREFGTQFIKSNPNPQSIADLMEKFIGLKNEELQVLSQNGYKWAEEKFNINRICGFIENWVDSLPEIDYDFKTDLKNYNDSYPFKENILKDEDWCLDLLFGIFNQKETLKSQTVKKMMERLSRGEKRKDIYNKSINIARSFNENKKEKLAVNYFNKGKEVGNVAIITPNSIEEKILLLGQVEKIVNENAGEADVFIISDDIDLNIFNQYKVVFLPKASRSSDPRWLLNLENKKGEKRFKKVFFKKENAMTYAEN